MYGRRLVQFILQIYRDMYKREISSGLSQSKGMHVA